MDPEACDNPSTRAMPTCTGGQSDVALVYLTPSAARYHSLSSHHTNHSDPSCCLSISKMATGKLERVLSKQHFTALPSREESRAIAQKHFEEYAEQPIEDKPFVAEETLTERDRLWGRWTQ